MLRWHYLDILNNFLTSGLHFHFPQGPAKYGEELSITCLLVKRHKCIYIHLYYKQHERVTRAELWGGTGVGVWRTRDYLKPRGKWWKIHHHHCQKERLMALFFS